MADIDITQAHNLTSESAKAAAQEVIDKLSKQFELKTQWEGDVLTFKRDGVSGSLAVEAQRARLEITLNLLFKAFAPKIEEMLSEKMRKVFECRA